MNIFELPPAPTAAVAGSDDRFPVRRIFCVGRNYAEHAREMGFDPDREPPFFFTKFGEAVVPNGSTVSYPRATLNYHFEAELVVAIGRSGPATTEAEALDLIWGYGVGLDMTRRDLQMQAREKGRPWDTGKNFEESAPLASLHKVAEIGHISSGAITLTVNGQTKQSADIANLIWNVPEVIQHLAEMYTLQPGDLVYTGTPAGVGPVVAGDTICVEIAGLTPLQISIVESR